MNTLCHICSYNNKIKDIPHSKCDVMWVGVSLKKCMEPKDALSPLSSSGNLLTKIENTYPIAKYYRTNILKCAPIDITGKLRNPTHQEMNNCYYFLEKEIQYASPKIVFLLGGFVSKFVLNKLDVHFNSLPVNYQYQVNTINGIKYVAVHHPSYINVYKKHYENQYIESISKLIKNCMEDKIDLELPTNPQLSDFQQYVKRMKSIRNFNTTDCFYECCLFAEECGEVISAIRKNTHGGSIGSGSSKGNIGEELADVFMYVCSLANMFDIDLEKAFREKEEKNKKRIWKKL